ncbi:Na/Pi cotransporter family protein [Chelativorans composti]|jgi:Na/Pi-cotransporter|uniref:Na/Pi cotransporter family protein n=1 Tax=Chelativorans composti TaxID=768533 RepID=A0ABW5DDY3_9HYPH
MELVIGLVTLAGHIALLLWGTRMVQTGIQRAFGPDLRSFLGHALKNRLKAFGAGLFVTAILQSSTATGLMAAAFTAGGLVELTPALAVMLGANVGSTLIVQVLSFNIAAVAPVLILIGVLMFRQISSQRIHDLGRVMIGLGFMIMALHQLLELLERYENSPGFSWLLSGLADATLFNILLAGVLTWAAHSSVAVVLLIMSLATKGMVDPQQAFAMVVGANLGTALNPVLESDVGDDLAGKRLPVGNLLTRLVGVLAVTPFLAEIARLFSDYGIEEARAVADFHTAFNLVLAIVFLPVLGPFARLLERLLPQRIDESDPTRPRYLDPAARETPVVALGAATREALRLVDVLGEMIEGAKVGIAGTDRKALSDLRRKDNVIDSLNAAIKSYLTSIDPEELSLADKKRLNEILLFSTNLEHAGDIVDRGLIPHLNKRLRRGLNFSKEGQKELEDLFDRLLANLQMAGSLLVTQDERTALMLVKEKAEFRRAEFAAMQSHFRRLQQGDMDTSATTSLHLDVIRDLRLINSYLVAAAAQPILNVPGELAEDLSEAGQEQAPADVK